jgi:fluoroquinolone resistance protein
MAPMEQEITGADWCAEDLTGHEHARVVFTELDLSETTGQGASFSECAFRDCRFNACELTGAAFLNCLFTRCSFFDATLRGCKLLGSSFDRCRFGELCVEGGDWSFAALPGAELARSRFTDVRMREVDLIGAQCQGAVMLRVDLSGSSLARVDFSTADLRGSDLSSLDPMSVRLEGTIVDPDQAIVLAGALGVDVRLEEAPA